MKCKHCGHELTAEFLASKKDLMRKRMREARALAKLHGEQVGAKKVYDYDKIRALRKTGLTIRQIAKKLGSSTMPVFKALKEKQ